MTSMYVTKKVKLERVLTHFAKMSDIKIIWDSIRFLLKRIKEQEGNEIKKIQFEIILFKFTYRATINFCLFGFYCNVHIYKQPQVIVIISHGTFSI